MRKPSHQTQLVFQALLENGGEEMHGYALSKATTLPSGVIYPILRRLEGQGLVVSRWEEDARRKRFYRLTGEGRRVARVANAEQAPALRMLLNPSWNT